jgi:ATP-dependent Clp protease protease subunit
MKLKAPPNNKYWSVETSTDDKGNAAGELYLYGYICSEKWWDEDITPKGLIEDLEKLGTVSELNVHLFSNGGDVFAGNAIYSILKQRKETVNVYVEGIAASIATVIAMAADKIYIEKNAMFMVHNVMVGVFFALLNRTDLQKMIAELDRVSAATIRAYTDRTGMSDRQIYDLLDANEGDGTWMNAEEAIAAGFCDAITPDSKSPAEMAAMIRPNVYKCRGHEIDMSIYKQPPRLTASVKQAAKTGVKKTMAKKVIKPQAVVEALSCPSCGVRLELNTSSGDLTVVEEEVTTVAVPLDDGADDTGTDDDMQAKRGGKFRAELFKLECPMCGNEWEHDTATGEDTNLTESTATDPVPQAKSAAKTKMSSKNAKYEDGIAAERERILGLDACMRAAPQYAAQIEQFKRDGTTVAEANAWIIGKLSTESQTQASNGADYLAGARRDAAPLNKIGQTVAMKPPNQMSAEQSAFNAALLRAQGRLPDGENGAESLIAGITKLINQGKGIR